MRPNASLRKLLAAAGTLIVFSLFIGVIFGTLLGKQDVLGESNLPFLYGVYTVTWATFFAYAFYVSRRQRELRRQIDELRRVLEERGN